MKKLLSLVILAVAVILFAEPADAMLNTGFAPVDNQNVNVENPEIFWENNNLTPPFEMSPQQYNKNITYAPLILRK